MTYAEIKVDGVVVPSHVVESQDAYSSATHVNFECHSKAKFVQATVSVKSAPAAEGIGGA